VSNHQNPSKETVLIHELSPELEKELLHRAQTNNRNIEEEAATIIEEHVEEEGMK
jgi:hypothetical protein